MSFWKCFINCFRLFFWLKTMIFLCFDWAPIVCRTQSSAMSGAVPWWTSRTPPSRDSCPGSCGGATGATPAVSTGWGRSGTPWTPRTGSGSAARRWPSHSGTCPAATRTAPGAERFRKFFGKKYCLWLLSLFRIFYNKSFGPVPVPDEDLL